MQHDDLYESHKSKYVSIDTQALCSNTTTEHNASDQTVRHSVDTHAEYINAHTSRTDAKPHEHTQTTPMMNG